MRHFPEGITFCYPRRSYQAKVLEELDGHLDDDNLNIVAAPGSGKTILGLEVMLRINKPTIILAPSLAIRNQWLQRFKENFLMVSKKPEWISLDIKEPKFLTITTYQGLHSVFSDAQKKEKLIIATKRLKVQTIIIDEAHHLRNAWWESLVSLKNIISKVHVVSLTATPPFDVSGPEWDRYKEMCGEIDAEISVPELVQKNNLCPHQDYIYLNHLTQEEKETLQSFRYNVGVYLNNLSKNLDFIESLKNHPFLLDPQNHIEDILENPSYFSSMLIFLNSIGIEIEKKLLDVIGAKQITKTHFDTDWAQILLRNYIFGDPIILKNQPKLHEKLYEDLQSIGTIEKKKLKLHSNENIEKLFRSSLNKLKSISEIVRIESKSLGDDLRMVILTDYIRKEYLRKNQNQEITLNKIGVVPIFEKIRQDFKNIEKIGILCGTLVLIPSSSIQNYLHEAKKLGIEKNEIKFTKIATHEGLYARNDTCDFYSVSLQHSSSSNMVHIVTELFNNGSIQILVGTKSLLGEGWDAPSINSLILASFVGSFMLSNQMRGRAIRIDKNAPNKTANIWHLASMQLDNNYLGDDYETLKRRFRAFVGVYTDKKTVESGIERMNIGEEPYDEDKIKSYNKKNAITSSQRAQLAQQWKDILSEGSVNRIITEYKVPKTRLQRNFIKHDMLSATLWRTSLISGYMFLQFFESFTRFNIQSLEYVLLMSIGGSLIFTLPSFIRISKAFIKNAPVRSNMKQIGKSILSSMKDAGLLKTDLKKLQVVSHKDRIGNVYCGLIGARSHETNIFIQCLEEILGPIKNPRYIVIRKNRSLLFLRKDYHSVPSIFGYNKDSAIIFEKNWSKYVSKGEIIYTRNYKGRKELLQARKLALANIFLKPGQRIDIWK